jgi:dihydrofolate reductase
MVAMHKFVISNTLQTPAPDTTVVGGDIAAGIGELKQRHSGDLLLICGPDLFTQLTANELIDEYILYISPLALSGGGHLFRDARGPIPVRVTSTRPFKSGMTLHRYLPLQGNPSRE